MAQLYRYWKTVWAGLLRVFRQRIPVRLSQGRLIGGLSIVALLFLSCVFGAASVHFEFFPGTVLRDAFIGYTALQERGVELTDFHSNWTGLGITCDKSDKTSDGFTLYTTTQGTKAQLIDMKGNVVHQWSLPFSKVWSNPKHIRSSPLPDEQIHWFRCKLFPNGDLLAIYQTSLDTPPGYGLAKLDKNSNLIWAYSANVHHDLDVAEDGTIYALTHQLMREIPHGLTSIPPPLLVDSLVQLSAQGQELQKISLLESFRDTPFAALLFAQAPPADLHSKRNNNSLPTGKESYDILHANAVKVLNSGLAPKFPLFKKGQVLLSFRSINTIAVLDIRTHSLVWAVQGIWQQQHDPAFLDSGHLLVYDNSGSGRGRGSRILEFDPGTHGYSWTYSNEDSVQFTAANRGTKQQLPNGNVLITDPNGGRIFEVARNRERVWEFCCAVDPDLPIGNASNLAITGAERYAPDQLTFLKGQNSVRP